MTRNFRASRPGRRRYRGWATVASAVAIVGLTAGVAPAQAAALRPGRAALLAGRDSGRPAVRASGLPCDVYSADGTPCVAAYSMDRALYASYDGPLYRVRRASDGAARNIGLLAAGGDVNAAEQDSFCAGTTCVVTKLFDQSPEGNDLTVEGAGGAAGADHGASASALPVTVGGHEAYGLDVTGKVGYRDDGTHGVAIKAAPEGMYMVASGTHVNPDCCFDFGNAETDNKDDGAGAMDAVNVSTKCHLPPCTGSGPWVQADLENGVYQGGNGSNPKDTPVSSDFVTAMLRNDGGAAGKPKTNLFDLQGGNAQAGGLTTYWNGQLPSGYAPMRKQGAIVLGTGGDNSNADVGSFFEGVITSGYPTAAAETAVQASIVAAAYVGDSGAPPPGARAGRRTVRP